MSLLRRHPLVGFFVLAYGLSWAYWIPLALAGVRTAPGSSTTHEPGLLGPALAAFIMTGLTEGRSGVTAFAKRLALVSRAPWNEFAIYSGLPPLGLPALLLLVLNRCISHQVGRFDNWAIPAARSHAHSKPARLCYFRK